MNYVPKPDVEGINSPSYTTPAKDLAILLAGVLGIIVAVYFVLILISNWALTRISIEDEVKLFGKIFNAERFVDGHSEDLNKLATKLNKEVSFPLKLGIVCDEKPNAFAFPGGTILVTSGLLKSIKSENGLTFVLGHEIGHFVNRDHLRGYGQKIILAVGMGLFGFDNFTELASINDFLGKVYDRSNESSADEYGINLSKKTYGHTFGAEEFFKVITDKNNILDSKFGQFLSTHPASAQRLAIIKATQVGEPAALIMPEHSFTDWIKEARCKK